jgi:ankyrin repeat protein
MLWWAANYDNTKMIKALLDAKHVAEKIDVNAADINGATPLWWAANRDNEGVVEDLLKATNVAGKINVNAAPSGGSTPGSTPLWWAAYHKNVKMVNALLNAKHVAEDIDVNAAPSDGDWKDFSPLRVAIEFDLSGIARIILRYNPSVSKTDVQLARAKEWHSSSDIMRKKTFEMLETASNK